MRTTNWRKKKIVPPSDCDFLPAMYVHMNGRHLWCSKTTAHASVSDINHRWICLKCVFAPICAHEWNPILFIECGYSGNNQPCQWAKNRSPNHFLKSQARTYFRFPRSELKRLYFLPHLPYKSPHQRIRVHSKTIEISKKEKSGNVTCVPFLGSPSSSRHCFLLKSRF